MFANAKVTDTNVLAPHRAATLQRIAQHPVVLLVQDTTEMDFTTKKDKIHGLGPLNDDSRQGLFLHPLVAWTPEKVCLGTVHTQFLIRTALGQRDQRKQRPIQDKESFRWIEGYRQGCQVAAEVPGTTCVVIADREGDIYEWFTEAQPAPGQRPAEWIIRAQHDRCTQPEAEVNKVKSLLAREPVLGELVVDLPRTAQRAARTARLTVRARGVALRPPYRPGEPLPAVSVNVVWVQEVKPPAGEKPVEWLLLTSLPVDTFAQAARVVDDYCCRPQIEVLFRVLKSGCLVEDLQLEQVDRLKPCLALYLIAAWRVLYVMWLGREFPDMPCAGVFVEEEWKSVWRVVTKKPVPTEPPTLAEFLELVASLGGHLGRKHDGDPGPKALWIGLQRMHDFAQAWLMFGPSQ